MKIKIALEQVLYGFATPAESRRRGAPAEVPAVARKAAGSRAGDVGAEAEALANEKLVQAGRRADVAISGRGPMLQRRGLGMRPAEPPPALAERVTAYLSRQYEGPRRLRLPVTSTAELASAVRAAVPGAELLAEAALHRIIDEWRAERRLGAAGAAGVETGAPASGASGLPPLPGPAPSRPSALGTRLSDLARFLSRIPTSVALGDPESLEFRAGKDGLRLAHERPGLKLAATMGWDRTLGAQARHGDLSFTASADVLGGERQALTFGLRYGPSAPDLARLPTKMQRAGQGVGEAAVNLPRFVSFLREGGVDELSAIPDAVEQARRIAGERERRVPISLGLTASVSREGEGPPGVSVMGNLTLAWDVLKKAKPGAPETPPGPGPASAVAIPRGGGQPLAGDVLARLEGLFGRRIPDLRIHTGPAAEAAAAGLGAEAFTLGRDIYFGKGKFAPESRQGLGLLGHEVTHVLQQEQGRANGVRRAGGDTGTLEREAEAAARTVQTASSAVRTGALVIDAYRQTYRPADGQPLTEAERATVDLIATRGREACEQILQAEHPSVLTGDRALPRLRMTFDVDLASTDPDTAVQAWGRKMAETIVGAVQSGPAPTLAAQQPSAALLSPNPASPGPPAAAAAPATPAPAAGVTPPPPPPPSTAPAPAAAAPVAPPVVTDQDRDLLRRVEVRAKVLAKMKEREELKKQYANMPEVKVGTPPAGIATAVPDRLSQLNDEIDRLLGEAGVQTEAQYQAERAKRLLPGPDVPMSVQQQLDLIPSQLADHVGYRATQMAYYLLSLNEAVAQREKVRYSKGVEGFDPKKQRGELRDAAWELHVAKTASDQAALELGKLLAVIGGIELFSGASKDKKGGDYFSNLLKAKKEKFQEKHDHFKGLKSSKLLMFPILGGEWVDYLQISRLTPEGLEKLFTSKVDEVLDNISKTREHIGSDKLKPITLEPVLQATKELMGIKPFSPADEAVKKRLESIEKNKQMIEWATLALSIGTALLMAVPGLNVLAGAASLGLGVYGAVQAIEEAGIKGAAAASAISKAQAISQDEPSFFWLAIAIVGVLPDAAMAARAFGRLLTLRRAVVAAGDVAKAKGESALAGTLRKEGNAIKPGMGDTLAEQAAKERELRTSPPRSASDAEPPTVREPRGSSPDSGPPTVPEPLQVITEDYLTVHRSAEDAYRSYRDARRLDPTREVGIWENSRTKEWVVGYGHKDKVLGPYQIDPKTKDVWKLIEHYHPSNDSVDLLARVPSNNDFFNVCEPIDPSKRIESTLSWKDPVTGRPRTSWFGRDPGDPKPFWIRYADLDEKGGEVLATRRFSSEPWKGKGRIEYELFIDEVKEKQSRLIRDAPTNPMMKAAKPK